MLTMLGPFSIDMYLPGFGAIAKELQTDMARVGWSLTSFFLGIAIGQLFYGPILDRFGRKKPVIIGLVIYILSCMACATVADIDHLIAYRVLMALGACAGMVASRAIVRDLFEPKDMARVFSILMLVIGVAPIIAPTVGGTIVSELGWRSIFYALAGFGVVLLGIFHFTIKESHQPDSSVSLRPDKVFKEYWQVISTPDFFVYSVGGGLAMAGLFAYISGSPFVYMELFGLTEEQFGWAFGLNAAGLILGSQICRYLLKHFDEADIILVSTIVMFLSGVLLITITYAGFMATYGTMGLLFIYLFALGFALPTTGALSLAPFTRLAGSASAMNGFFRMIMGAASSAMVSYLSTNNPSALPMKEVIAVCITASMALIGGYYIMNRRQAMLSSQTKA